MLDAIRHSHVNDAISCLLTTLRLSKLQLEKISHILTQTIRAIHPKKMMKNTA